MNVQAYLQRINYNGPLSVTSASLRRLQVAHLQTVPFENLSIHSDEPIILDDEALFDKIVARNRGGFCYELNGLFTALLRSLGFNVSMLSAQVAGPDGSYGPDFDHMALMVTLDDRWLVDVGFGDSFLEPLLLDTEAEQRQGLRTYRISKDGDAFIIMQRADGDDWKAQYRFTLKPHRYSDYLQMCLYHQTSPQSHFTQQRVCSMATTDGRITLSGKRLITSSASGERHEQTLHDEGEIEMALQEHFGVIMNKNR